MTGFFAKTKKFAQDFTRRAGSKLFSFRKDMLNPVVAALTEKADAIVKLDDMTQKTEQLFALKDEAWEKLYAVHQRDGGKPGWFIVMGLAAMGAAGATLGFVGLVVGVAVFDALAIKCLLNANAAFHRGQVMEGKIDREILNMASGPSRTSLFSVPRFQQELIDKGALRQVFSAAEKGDAREADYAEMVRKSAGPKGPT